MNITLKDGQMQVFSLLCQKLGNDNVFLVGGCLRDALLDRESFDMDFAVRNDPGQIAKLFPYALYYEKFGTISFKLLPYHVTIASFREEKKYSDFRHPQEVHFVNSLYRDYKRRDFTINCLYLDYLGNLIDPTRKGMKDIENHRIRTVGNPYRRLQEDPLRILRAVRFSLCLGFSLSPMLEKGILRLRPLVDHLNPDKIRQEIDKCEERFRKEMVLRLNLEEYLEKKEEKVDEHH